MISEGIREIAPVDAMVKIEMETENETEKGDNEKGNKPEAMNDHERCTEEVTNSGWPVSAGSMIHIGHVT